MQSQRTRDTQPELAVRRLLHAQGLRYRVDRAPLPSLRRRADIVFGPARVAVYIDGCFWHGCPVHGNQPRANSEYWAPKLAGNRQRDTNTDRHLADAGWTVVRAWEHEDPQLVAARVQRAVRPGGRPRSVNSPVTQILGQVPGRPGLGRLGRVAGLGCQGLQDQLSPLADNCGEVVLKAGSPAVRRRRRSPGKQLVSGFWEGVGQAERAAEL